MTAIIQRLKSKTFWAAILGSVVTVFEVNSGFFGGFMPEAYRPALLVAWPVLMLVLREFTTKPLSQI